MRAVLAKKIRRAVYDDMSLKEERRYRYLGKTRFSTGLRRDYLLTKRQYKRLRGAGKHVLIDTKGTEGGKIGLD